MTKIIISKLLVSFGFVPVILQVILYCSKDKYPLTCQQQPQKGKGNQHMVQLAKSNQTINNKGGHKNE